MKRFSLLTLVLLMAVMGVYAEEPAPWKSIQTSIPFKNVWSAEIRDHDGTHAIVNCWVEKEYKKGGRTISALERDTIGEEAAVMLGSRIGSHGYEKLMFVESHTHRLYAIEVESGVIKWAAAFPRAIQYAPYFGNDKIFLTSDEILFATNREYGLLAWRMPLDFAVSTSPIMGEAGLLYMSSWENRVFCIDAESQVQNWQYRVDGNIVAAPLYDSGLVYVPSESGNLYCLKNTGDLVFKYPTKGALTSSPRIKEGFLIIGSADNSLYCLNRYNGEKVWEARLGRPITTDPEIIGRNVFVKPEGAGITAISMETGKVLWEMPQTNKIIGFGKKALYLYTGEHRRDRLVVGVDQETGNILWVWNPKDNIKKHFDYPLKNVNEVNKVFFVGTNPGRLYMLGEKGYYERLGEARRAALGPESEADSGETQTGTADGSEGTPEEGDDGLEGLDDLLDLDDI